MWGVTEKIQYSSCEYFLEELLALSPAGQGAADAADLSPDLCEYKKNCSNPRWRILLMLHCPF